MPRRHRGWSWTSESSSSGRCGAIMTPSPCSLAGSSRGWTRRPASSSGTPSSRETRSRRDFIGAWRNLPTLRDPDRFEAWLHRLVFRACIDILRRRGRRSIEVELTPVDGPAISDMASIVADRELLDAALRRLRPGGARAVIVLHFYLGLPLTDVAAALDIPVGTAKSRLHRGLDDDARLDHRPTSQPGRRASRREGRSHDRVRPLRAPSCPQLMAELAPARVPDYFDDMLRQSARTRQRPGLERPRKVDPHGRHRPDRTRSARFPGGRSWSPRSSSSPSRPSLAAVSSAPDSAPAPPPFGPANNGSRAHQRGDGEILAVDLDDRT